MTCPNCGTPYSEHETICKKCNQPLGNAHYTPIRSHASRRRAGKQKRKRRWLLPVFLLLFILIVGGVCCYFYYIHQIKKNCEAVTHEIFTYAEKMDFSDIDASYLPEPLQENPDIKSFISNHISSVLEENGLDALFDLSQTELDADLICKEIMESASYEITDITADYRSCTVTVHTQNVDFTRLPDIISQKADALLDGPSESLWEGIKNLFHDIFIEDEESEDMTETLYEWYQEAMEDAPLKEADGSIVYEMTDGSWKLAKIDTNLFYAYYGIDSSFFD